MRFVYALILMMICCGASAQPVEEFWAVSFPDEQYGNFDGLHQTADGGYIVGGEKSGVGLGQDEFWMMKLSRAGEEQWIRFYGTDSVDVLRDVIEIDGGYVMAGVSEGFPPAETAGLLILLDVNGDSVDSFVYDDYLHTQFNSLIQTPDGGVLAVGGVTNSENDDLWSPLAIKFNSEFEEAWTEVYQPGFNTRAYEVLVTADSGYALGCNQTGLRRLNTEGEQLWYSQVGRPHTIVELGNGGFAGLVTSPELSTMRFVDSDGEPDDLVHYSIGNDTSITGAQMVPFRDQGFVFAVNPQDWVGSTGKFALTRTDTTGDSLWVSSAFIQDWDAEIHGMIQLEDGGFALCGRGFILGEGIVNWVFRTTPDGSIISTHSLTAIYLENNLRLRWSVNPELAETIAGFRVYASTTLSEPYETYLGYVSDTTYVHESALAESDLFYYFIVSRYGFPDGRSHGQLR